MKKSLYFIIVLIFAGFCFSCDANLEPGIVSVSGRKILLDGSPYLIKGVCYHPVPRGSNERDFSNLDQDILLMKEAGVNAIRVYVPIVERSVLDQLDEAGLKVIMGFGYNQGGEYDILSGTYVDYVNEFKSHDAILFWELGNEYNYHPEWFEGDISNWYSALNIAARTIHQNDPLHPVATAHGELPDSLALAICKDIDIWGMNVYRWDKPESIFDEWKNISLKPMYLSEAGADSYMTISEAGYEKGENQKAQADAVANILNGVFKNQEICSGVTLFAFVDELWKAGNNDIQDIGGWAPKSSGVPYDGAPNEEYWGIVDIDRNKKEAFQVVKSIFREVKLK